MQFAKATHIFSAKILAYIIYAIFDDQSFNDTLIKDIVNLKQLGPDIESMHSKTPVTQTSMACLQWLIQKSFQ